MEYVIGFYVGGFIVSAAPWLKPPLTRGWVWSVLLSSLMWPIWIARLFFNAWRNR